MKYWIQHDNKFDAQNPLTILLKLQIQIVVERIEFKKTEQRFWFLKKGPNIEYIIPTLNNNQKMWCYFISGSQKTC